MEESKDNPFHNDNGDTIKEVDKGDNNNTTEESKDNPFDNDNGDTPREVDKGDNNNTTEETKDNPFETQIQSTDEPQIDPDPQYLFLLPNTCFQILAPQLGPTKSPPDPQTAPNNGANQY